MLDLSLDVGADNSIGKGKLVFKATFVGNPRLCGKCALLSRLQWEALDDKEKQKYPFEQELWEWLEKMMSDLRCGLSHHEANSEG